MNKKQTYLKIQVLVLVLLSFFMLESCRQNSNNSTETNETEAYLTVNELLKQAPSLLGQEVKLQGFCTGICKRSGKKIFLLGDSEDEVLRVEATEDFDRFSEDCVDHNIHLRGILEENRIDEAYLKEWEEKLKDRAVKSGEKKADKEEKSCCNQDKKSRGIDPHKRALETIEKYRGEIAEREAKEGKAYLSFYYVSAREYTIDAER